jgi:hypothetical protein
VSSLQVDHHFQNVTDAWDWWVVIAFPVGGENLICREINGLSRF